MRCVLFCILNAVLFFGATAPAAAVLQSDLQFEQLPPLPTELGLGGPIAGAHNGALIVGGGANFPTPLVDGGAKLWHAQMWVLQDPTGAWHPVQALAKPLAYAACASTPHGVAVLGGSDAEQVFATAFLIQWDNELQEIKYQSLPPLPTPSAFGAAQCVGEQLYVWGGKTAKDDTQLSGEFWQLDLSQPQARWKELPTYPGSARYKMATAVQADVTGEACLFMFSGSRVTNGRSTQTLQDNKSNVGKAQYHAYSDGFSFKPSTQRWTPIAELPVLSDSREIDGKQRFENQRWPINAATAHAYGDQNILTFSGSTDRYIYDAVGDIIPPQARPQFLNRVLSYNTHSDQWQLASDMPTGVVTTTAVRWMGKVVIPSGEIKPGVRTPQVQALELPATINPARFAFPDYVVLAIYLLLMVGVGVYFAKKSTSTEDFFLAGRKIPWWAAGISIFGTQLSAITFMAIPATAYGSDWRRFVGQLMVMPVFLIVIYSFLPLFRRLNITTAYEYLEQRFSLSIRLFASGLFVLFQIGRMGIVLLLPAIALSAVTGLQTHTCIALMGVLATAYTALGGISAVIWTDVLQVVVLIGGALACLLIAIAGAGGFSAAWDVAQSAEKFHMFDWSWDPTDMVGWVLIVGFFFTNLVPYTTDQTIIQRYLTTRDEKQAARSMWLNLLITIPTGLLFFGLGTALFAYYTAHPAEQAQLPGKADQLVPWFVMTHLPAGVAGIVVAGIFAAAMSSLDSSINSITTALVNDFVGRLRKTKQDYMRLARILTLVLGVLGTLTAMVLATVEIRYLFDFFQKLLGLFGGALAGVFLLAAFTKRTHSRGALLGMLTGAALTIAVAFGTQIHFLLYAAVGSLSCVIVGYFASLVLVNKDENRLN
jgi:solute:Na+ symporter, SSS family